MTIPDLSHACLTPHWPAPSSVRALVTTRQSGNLATHVIDDPVIVTANRARLRRDFALPQEPLWLEQTHSIIAIDLDSASSQRVGDAAYTRTPGTVCAVLTADCLPILIASHSGDEVAAIHAGWRGLAAGVIAATVQSLQTPATALLAWLGPAIGPDHFEVGPEVREQFIAGHPNDAIGFQRGAPGRWLGNMYTLATLQLRRLGITAVYGGGLCTVCDPEQFYSYRREHDAAGRMASLIWIAK